METMQDDYEIYLRGEKLYGDDFSRAEIEEWFKDEEDAYYEMTKRHDSECRYSYHALNWYHAFRFLSHRRFHHTLGFGSAYGEELRPLAKQSDRITILEPSAHFAVQELEGRPVQYVRPQADGILPFAQETFDLIFSLGVLHHIPNVSTVIRELARCLQPGGYAIFREPVVSMGDWRQTRKGLTKRERGIPLTILREILLTSGFQIVQERRCMFPVTARLRYLMRSPVYNSPLCVRLDEWVSRLPFWPDRYHPTRWYHKLRPWAVFVTARKVGHHEKQEMI
jgi:SAM-dependent methyltransferase